MTLKTSAKDKDVKQAAPEKDAAEAKTLVLTQYTRFGYKGRTYESSFGYKFSAAEEAEMLKLESDGGVPVWKVAKGNVPTVEVAEGAVELPSVAGSTPTEKGIELGTEQEMKELGLDKVDAGAGTGTGVQV